GSGAAEKAVVLDGDRAGFGAGGGGLKEDVHGTGGGVGQACAAVVVFGEGAADRDIAEGQRTQGDERQGLRSGSGTDGEEPEIEPAGGGVQRCKDRDPADAEVVIVGDQKIARSVLGDPADKVKFGAGGRTSVAAEARLSVSSDGGHQARGVDPAHALTAVVRDEQVAVRIHPDAIRMVQLVLDCRPVTVEVASA